MYPRYGLRKYQEYTYSHWEEEKMRLFAIYLMIIFAGIVPREIGEDEPAELPVCGPDGNDTVATAMEIENGTTTIEVICPEDPVDFYSFYIPAGADVEGGIIFASSEPGTRVRLSEEDRAIYNNVTTLDEHRLIIPVEISDATGATYFLRITSDEGTEPTHYYGISIGLTLTGCFPDGNETREDAERIFFGESTAGTFCIDDTVDWYRIHNNSVEEAEDGWFKITPSSLPTRIQFYNTYDHLLLERTLGAGVEEFKFSDIDGIAHFQSYYLKISVTGAVADEIYDYTLRFGVGDPPALSSLPFVAGGYTAIQFPIWGTADHDMFRTSRTGKHGPSNAEEISYNRISRESMYIAKEPVVAPNGDIYYIKEASPSDSIQSVGAYGNPVWTKRLQDDLFGLHMDSEGFWTANHAFIYHFDYSGNNLPTVPMPAEIAGDVKFLGMYDDRLYFSGGSLGFDFWCLNKEGGIIYLADAGGPVRSIAVDRDNNVYILSYFNLTKLNSSGSEQWRKWFRDAHRYDETIPGESSVHYPLFGPRIGKDNNVLVAYVADDMTEWMFLYGPDGSMVKHNDTTRDGMPVDGAIDPDGNYYIVKNSNTIRKYNKSLNSEWVHDIPGQLDDILMDGRGMIYLAYHVAGGLDFFVIRCMDLDGHLRWQTIIEDITYVGQDAWLQVDEDKHLIFLTSAGQVITIEGLEMEFTPSTPGAMQQKGFGG